MNHQYFDINLISDYLSLGLDFRVYVDGQYLTVSEPEDLINSRKGVGYTDSGKPIEFRFLDIDHVRIGSITLTRDQLNDFDKDSENKADDSQQEDEPASEQGGEEEPEDVELDI